MNLLGCAAFGSSTFDIGASFGINPHPHDSLTWFAYLHNLRPPFSYRGTTAKGIGKLLHENAIGECGASYILLSRRISLQRCQDSPIVWISILSIDDQRPCISGLIFQAIY